MLLVKLLVVLLVAAALPLAIITAGSKLVTYPLLAMAGAALLHGIGYWRKHR